MDELSELITSSSFHPTDHSTFLYSTSKGIIKVGDLRISCRSNKNNTL